VTLDAGADDQPRAARRIGVCLETVTMLEKGRLGTAALEVRARVFAATAEVKSALRIRVRA
jgi:hypothetical protein